MAREMSRTNSPYNAGRFEQVVEVWEITGYSDDVTPVPIKQKCFTSYAIVEGTKALTGDHKENKDTVDYDYKVTLRIYYPGITPHKHRVVYNCTEYDVITVEEIGRRVHTCMMIKKVK